jgi:septation ring formation regulator EzrA
MLPRVRPESRRDLARDVTALRDLAERRYSEVDLLVAALREHVADLQHERDRLLSEVARLRDDTRRDRAAWLTRGTKPNR